MYLENRQDLLEVNVSNKNDVIEKLGQPHSKSIKEENTWLYIERTKTKDKIYTLGRSVLINNNVLVVKFNNYGVLEEKLFYDKKNMKDYKFTKAETDNEVTRGSFVQSFLQSFLIISMMLYFLVFFDNFILQNMNFFLRCRNLIFK